jgi:hypothetical protein
MKLSDVNQRRFFSLRLWGATSPAPLPEYNAEGYDNHHSRTPPPPRNNPSDGQQPSSVPNADAAMGQHSGAVASGLEVQVRSDSHETTDMNDAAAVQGHAVRSHDEKHQKRSNNDHEVAVPRHVSNQRSQNTNLVSLGTEQESSGDHSQPAAKRARRRKAAPPSDTEVEVVGVTGEQRARRSAVAPVKVKVEDLEKGLIACPHPDCKKKSYGVLINSMGGCKKVTCTNHTPHFFVFCIHCKKEVIGGDQFSCDCVNSCSEDNRLWMQKKRNELSEKNPIEMEEEDMDVDSVQDKDRKMPAESDAMQVSGEEEYFEDGSNEEDDRKMPAKTDHMHSNEPSSSVGAATTSSHRSTTHSQLAAGVVLGSTARRVSFDAVPTFKQKVDQIWDSFVTMTKDQQQIVLALLREVQN